jgi:hypothetical protein
MTKTTTKQIIVYKRFLGQKDNAKHTYNVRFEASFEELLAIVTDKCPYTGIELEWEDPDCVAYNAPFLLRKDPKGKFRIENLIWASKNWHMSTLGYGKPMFQPGYHYGLNDLTRN